jgi:hypothetical protein
MVRGITLTTIWQLVNRDDPGLLSTAVRHFLTFFPFSSLFIRL